ncbi:hypothetical protein ACP4OV_025367 [Aristida adscensionis]
MACLLPIVLVAATVLTVPPEKMTAHAARTSPAEAFWRAALPDAPMPDAIVKLLHRPDGDHGDKPKDTSDPPPLPPMDFDYDEYIASPRSGAAAPSLDVLKRAAGGARNTAVGGDAAAAAFFLEEAVRVGESLPFVGSSRGAAATDGAEALAEAPKPPAAAPPLLQLHTVRAVRAVEGSRFVVCRRDAGAGDDAAVYACRSTTTAGPVRAYSVEVAAGERGDAAMTVAVVCRTGASRREPEDAALRLLGAKPGGAAVCHAVPDALVLPAEMSPSSA